ncbi:MAG TPA: 2OG-Fe(II) oxygenase [Burkholderiales bacterium]|nr:2OG-Fe(II) oxygenase [Burkholderiales bacterium]
MKLTVQQPGAREIKVKLLLAGGQSATLVVAPEHPLLGQLLATVAAADGAAPGRHPYVFQIPMEGGRASLAFAAHQLVGVITDPAVVMHGDAPVPEEVTVPVASAAAAAASAAQGQGSLVRHPVVQLDGFLSGSEVAWLMELAFAAESRFVPARVTDNKEDYRQSFMLAAPDVLKQLFVAKITAVMPQVMPQLRLGQFALGAIDCQVTASVDGSYFKAHTDAGVNETYKRQFSYVYYFNREPKGFTGGELRIYDDMIRDGKLAATDSFQLIEPRHNSMVFFQAAVMHEVMPVSVPSKQFRDARFTVNGWIERA